MAHAAGSVVAMKDAESELKQYGDTSQSKLQWNSGLEATRPWHFAKTWGLWLADIKPMALKSDTSTWAVGMVVLLNVLRCQLIYYGQTETDAEAWFNIALRPRKPEGSLGRTAQDRHIDSHTAPELWSGPLLPRFPRRHSENDQ